MKRTRVLGWAARAALVLAMVPLGACKDDSSGTSGTPGGGTASPLSSVWINQATTGGGGGTATPLSDVWVDSTTVTPTGAGAILPSIDEITYSFPKIPAYIAPPNAGYDHPLMTHSSAAAIVGPEDQLLTEINNYRLQTLGNQNQNLGNNQGGLGVPINGITVTAIPPSGKLRKNARAHCKHYGRYHAGALPQAPATNAEGDAINAGFNPDPGRLRKSNITATSAIDYSLSGAAFDNAQNTFNAMQSGNHPVLTTTAYSYIGIGHWPQGDQQYYWNIVLGNGVNPVN